MSLWKSPNYLKRIVAFFCVSVPIHIAVAIGVLAMTEMVFVLQTFTTLSIFAHVYAIFIELTPKNVLLLLFKLLLMYSLAVMGAISAMFVAAGGNTMLILVSWSAAIALACALLLECAQWPRKTFLRYCTWHAMTYCVFICVIFFGLESTQPTKQFTSDPRAFSPATITLKTLNDTLSIDSSRVATSFCYPAFCGRVVWPQAFYTYTIRSLPAGFRVAQSPHSVYTVDVLYDHVAGRNASLRDFPSYCDAYPIFVRCGQIYTASIGSIYIGTTCPYEKRRSGDVFDVGCQSRDFTAVSYVLWLGVALVFLVALLFSYQLYLHKRHEITSEKVEEEEPGAAETVAEKEEEDARV